MSHLSLETIARLVEDTPDGAESAHLESCAECRAQLTAMIDDVHALSLLPDMAAAPDNWAALEKRLIDEGLIRTQAQRFGGYGVRMAQVAAALMLFAGGTLAGRVAFTPEPVTTAAAPVASDIAPPTSSAPTATLAADEPARTPEVSRPSQPVNTSPVRLASSTTILAPGTVEEAAQLLRETEELYLAALTRYTELASGAPSGDPVARLAALQSIIMTTQAALSESPTDPVINGYHLTALAQRDATLRQVAAASDERWY